MARIINELHEPKATGGLTLVGLCVIVWIILYEYILDHFIWWFPFGVKVFTNKKDYLLREGVERREAARVHVILSALAFLLTVVGVTLLYQGHWSGEMVAFTVICILAYEFLTTIHRFNRRESENKKYQWD